MKLASFSAAGEHVRSLQDKSCPATQSLTVLFCYFNDHRGVVNFSRIIFVFNISDINQ